MNRITDSRRIYSSKEPFLPAPLGFPEVIRKSRKESLILAFAGLRQSKLEHQLGYSLLSLAYINPPGQNEG
jgi:hypothetical protein